MLVESIVVVLREQRERRPLLLSFSFSFSSSSFLSFPPKAFLLLHKRKVFIQVQLGFLARGSSRSSRGLPRGQGKGDEKLNLNIFLCS